MATLGQLFAEAEAAFAAAGLENPAHEAAYLFGARFECPPTMLTIRRFEVVAPPVEEELRASVARRARREPADHVIGWKEFAGRRFRVDRRALVPRPETELLAALAVRSAKKAASPARTLDVGTGTGCVAITVALEVPGTEVTAVDLSADALAVAEGNARALKAQNVRFFRSDLFDGLPLENRGYFDTIVSNPPYVSTAALSHLEPELSFEPGMALDGGPDGLDVVRRLVAGAADFLKPGGRLLVEIGFDQGPRAAALLSERGFGEVKILKDLNDHDRIATGVLSGSV